MSGLENEGTIISENTDHVELFAGKNLALFIKLMLLCAGGPRRSQNIDAGFLSTSKLYVTMILEVATIDIRPGTNKAFEENLQKAQHIISKSPGYIGHHFHQCVEQDNRYLLLIRWRTLEDHTKGFRESELFKEWRGLIGSFFESPPNVQHYLLKFEM